MVDKKAVYGVLGLKSHYTWWVEAHWRSINNPAQQYWPTWSVPIPYCIIILHNDNDNAMVWTRDVWRIQEYTYDRNWSNIMNIKYENNSLIIQNSTINSMTIKLCSLFEMSPSFTILFGSIRYYWRWYMAAYLQTRELPQTETWIIKLYYFKCREKKLISRRKSFHRLF